MEPPASPAWAARRIVSAASTGSSPKPFSRSAATGMSTAAAKAWACASASSRVTRPSCRPIVFAMAPLEVAIAAKPRPPRTRALPASQALAITKIPDLCSARNRATRSAASVVLGLVIAELLEGGQLVAETHPAEIMAQPGMVRGRKEIRLVEGAGGDVDRAGRIGVRVGERRAAVVAEGPRHRRRAVEIRRLALDELEAL